MNKKFISVIMAAILAVSATAVSASAAEAETEPSKASGTFFFDPGDWGTDATVCFYVWDATTSEFATKNGWTSDNTWGSAKKLGGTVKDGKYESFEIDLSGKENDKVYVIFHNKDTGGQTFDCVINDSAFGCTASRTGEMLENPEDSKKQAEAVAFDGGSGLGPAKLITSTGKVQGSIILPDTDRPDTVAKYVLKYLGQTDPENGTVLVTEQSVADAIAGFETTADEVWEKYKTHSGEENYNEEEAKKLIKPTEEKKDNDNSKTDGANSTSSNSSSTTSSKSSTTTTTTTTGTATTGTGTTTADGGAAATGDTRGVVAFAGVLVAAAGTILATRKKIED